MKTDKTKLLQDIEAMKEKLASMEAELNKPDEFKHFPSKGEIYHFYTSSGSICSNDSSSDDLKVNTYKTREEAIKAYDKAVALEKIKRRIIELQGEWEPDFSDTYRKYNIRYDYRDNRFYPDAFRRMVYYVSIPYMKSEKIALAIINEMEDELKFVFDIAITTITEE